MDDKTFIAVKAVFDRPAPGVLTSREHLVGVEDDTDADRWSWASEEIPAVGGHGQVIRHP